MLNEIKSQFPIDKEKSGKRKITIVANWKMNLNHKEAIGLAKDIKNSLVSLSTSEIVLCPPFLYISEIKNIFFNTAVQIGAQDVYWEKHGAYTGEISTKMLADFCKYIICGHSERRQLFQESDEEVNKKVQAILRQGIRPIICVGEDAEAWKKGDISSVLDQAKRALSGVEPEKITNIIFAYEPVWAIGLGSSATAEYANRICLQIRQLVESLYSRDMASKVRILYGGSVDAKNTVKFVEQSEIDGLLIGGASLKAKEFIDIVKKTGKVK